MRGHQLFSCQKGVSQLFSWRKGVHSCSHGWTGAHSCSHSEQWAPQLFLCWKGPIFIIRSKWVPQLFSCREGCPRLLWDRREGPSTISGQKGGSQPFWGKKKGAPRPQIKMIKKHWLEWALHTNPYMFILFQNIPLPLFARKMVKNELP